MLAGLFIRPMRMPVVARCCAVGGCLDGMCAVKLAVLCPAVLCCAGECLMRVLPRAALLHFLARYWPQCKVCRRYARAQYSNHQMYTYGDTAK